MSFVELLGDARFVIRAARSVLEIFVQHFVLRFVLHGLRQSRPRFFANACPHATVAEHAPTQPAFPSFIFTTKVNPSLLAPAITRGSLRVPLASSGLSARGKCASRASARTVGLECL